ncbi:ABC transporter permease [Micromonospora globispora]|uniref:ABC transporter permease n=1 Tax=Micromonospora globispora TaxID=1450148 RepID=UPI000F5D6451|nr:iron ABC transporter permease [Micromonospora globispora]RQW91805.1 hypothetical protein DKL51_20130 [Micromonospora globispora]
MTVLQERPTKQPAKRRATRSRGGGVGRAFVLVVAAIVAMPLVLLVLNSFNTAAGPTDANDYGLSNWTAAFDNAGIRDALWNSLTLSITRVAISLPLSCLIAWLIARTDLPGRSWLELAFWVGVFLPVLPRVFGWILLLSPDYGVVNVWLMETFGLDSAPLNIYSFWGITWVHLTSVTVYIQVVLLVPTFRRLGAALEEAARVAGASTAQMLARVTLPLLSPAIIGVGILGFVKSLEAFEVELLLGTPVGLDVYSTEIYNLLNGEVPNYGQATALGSLFLVILILLGIAYALYMKVPGRYATVTGKGYVAQRMRLGKARWPVAIVVYGALMIGLVVPTVLLVLGSFMTRYGYFDLPDTYTLAHWQDVLGQSILPESLTNSLTIAGASAVVAVFLYSVVSFLLVRGNSRWHRVADVLMWVPWAVPGILLGLGILWLFLDTPLGSVFYGTIGGLVFAIALKESPISTMLFKSSIQQLGPELEESARVSGASWGRTYAKVVLPLIAPAAMTVGTYVFLNAIGEISTIILLYTGDSRPLSMLMLEYSFLGSMEAGSVVGLLITGIVLVVVVLSRLWGVRLTGEKQP